ncbi:DUF6622 family protein [Estrella lausannensis]|uniref:Putative membrane protein n=1 Tax=Estrella lausannensis TaxID=483423 RepID=A0A0H5DQQ1_9BACT|nr:DUF6622 family protein [Estrella lausannensis]CRX37914.1 putative membrane protein [Estrella lausannensis]
MLTILVKTPLFVWPLLAFLIWGGVKSSKPHNLPVKTLLALPLGFFVWSLSTFLGRFGVEGSFLLLWLTALGSGFSIGYAYMQKLNVEFIHEKKTVMMPGSWMPLILSLSIFSAKFAVGIVSSVIPQPEGSNLLLSLELFSALILGIFLGRAIGCLMRFRSRAPSA